MGTAPAGGMQLARAAADESNAGRPWGQERPWGYRWQGTHSIGTCTWGQFWARPSGRAGHEARGWNGIASREKGWNCGQAAATRQRGEWDVNNTGVGYWGSPGAWACRLQSVRPCSQQASARCICQHTLTRQPRRARHIAHCLPCAGGCPAGGGPTSAQRDRQLRVEVGHLAVAMLPAQPLAVARLEHKLHTPARGCG